MFGPRFGFLILCTANPGAKRTGLDSISWSPVTWMVAEPATQNKSHVLCGVGLWELLLLSLVHLYHCTKQTKSYLHKFPWLSPARPDFASELPNY